MFNTYGSYREFLGKILNENEQCLVDILGSEKDWEYKEVNACTDSNIYYFIDKALGYKLYNIHNNNDDPKYIFNIYKFLSEEISLVMYFDHKPLTYEMVDWKDQCKEISLYKRVCNENNVIVKFSLFGIPIVEVNFDYIPGPGSNYGNSSKIIIFNKKYESKLLEKVLEIIQNASHESPYKIITFDSNCAGNINLTTAEGLTQRWEDLILNSNIIDLVRTDIESFINRKSWFKENHLPFKRGYLFHGPPGNGKTSVVKAILSNVGIKRAYSIRLFSKFVTDKTFESMFESAQKNSPSIILFEDLDRAFPKTGEKSLIGVHTLLNCIDGVCSKDGVITIATANEPSILDNAILKRPGRFDRVVLFDNPNKEARLKYFQLKLNSHEQNFEKLVDATDNFSFAQLQETYILAGQHIFSQNKNIITDEALYNAAIQLKETISGNAFIQKKKGF